MNVSFIFSTCWVRRACCADFSMTPKICALDTKDTQVNIFQTHLFTSLFSVQTTRICRATQGCFTKKEDTMQSQTGKEALQMDSCATLVIYDKFQHQFQDGGLISFALFNVFMPADNYLKIGVFQRSSGLRT